MNGRGLRGGGERDRGGEGRGGRGTRGGVQGGGQPASARRTFTSWPSKKSTKLVSPAHRPRNSTFSIICAVSRSMLRWPGFSLADLAKSNEYLCTAFSTCSAAPCGDTLAGVRCVPEAKAPTTGTARRGAIAPRLRHVPCSALALHSTAQHSRSPHLAKPHTSRAARRFPLERAAGAMCPSGVVRKRHPPRATTRRARPKHTRPGSRPLPAGLPALYAARVAGI